MLSVAPWDKQMVPIIEKAVMNADLGLNPATAGTVIRVPLPRSPKSAVVNWCGWCVRRRRAPASRYATSARDALGGSKELVADEGHRRRTKNIANARPCRNSPIATSPGSRNFCRPRKPN